jgi:hypothetical protein
LIGGDQGKFDIIQIFGQLPGAVAFDLDNSVAGLQMSRTPSIAIITASYFESEDELVTY